MNYLDSLNENQKKAALTTEGPVMIVAGAGAGKTKAITFRIFHLIQTGVPAEKILAITFTNKAAKEMRERVLKMLGEDETSYKFGKKLPFISTFHALGVQIIKENNSLLNLPKNFGILDKSDSKKALKDALVSVNIDPKEHLDGIRNIISREKGSGVSLSNFINRESYDFTGDLVKKAWSKYEEILKKENSLDFDDLLLKALKLLENQNILEKYQNRFLYVHIDEYQDTNKVQHKIAELLAKKNKNICVVGDTDQNIYSWRGAEIKNMLHFEKIYPEVQTFFLEQNYRSTKNILSVANEIIEKNNFRIPKKLFTDNEVGEKITIFNGRSETEEAHFIALKSKELIARGVQSEEIAVLYRANFQSRVLEEAFLSYGVPYQMLGTKFFERKEIKDVMSFLRLALNGENLIDLTRVINIPPRGIGKITLRKIVEGKEDELPDNVKNKIKDFRKMVDGFKTDVEKSKPSNALKGIIQKSGIEKMYATDSEEDIDRLENIMELVSLGKEYDIYPIPEGIEKFLTDTSLTSDQDLLDGSKNGVKLMTVHSAKGLEFDYVFISGLEDGLFPHNKNAERKKGEDLEEERRLFYVAVTRAKNKLFLTWAQFRTIFGSFEANLSSEFINDISSKYIENEKSLFGVESAYSIDF